MKRLGLLLMLVLVPGCSNVTPPIRATFYYPWYPETWSTSGHHVFYHPTLGYYSSDERAVVDAHIKALDYGRFDLSIASWWGQGHQSEQTRIPLLLDRTKALGSDLKWTLYYEKEGQGSPSVAELQGDLAYINQRYAEHPGFAWMNNKPVIFVYGQGESCETVSRWKQAARSNWYVVLKVFHGHLSCPSQPDAWHQYGPTSAAQVHRDSYVISPGFWHAGEPQPRLARDPARWGQNIRDMIASGKPLQIVTTFNEWGEGTAIEEATEWQRGFEGAYLDALHRNGSN
jgi:hypothetical protein